MDNMSRWSHGIAGGPTIDLSTADELSLSSPKPESHATILIRVSPEELAYLLNRRLDAIYEVGEPPRIKRKGTALYEAIRKCRIENLGAKRLTIYAYCNKRGGILHQDDNWDWTVTDEKQWNQDGHSQDDHDVVVNGNVVSLQVEASLDTGEFRDGDFVFTHTTLTVYDIGCIPDSDFDIHLPAVTPGFGIYRCGFMKAVTEALGTMTAESPMGFLEFRSMLWKIECDYIPQPPVTWMYVEPMLYNNIFQPLPHSVSRKWYSI